MFGMLYPHDEEHALVRIHLRFECPFTGKLFGSMDELVRAAISHLIREYTAEEQHDAERTGADVLHEDEEIPYLTHITLNTGQVRRIYPGEVDKQLYAAMKRVWKDSFKSEGVQLFEGYRFKSFQSRRVTVGTLCNGKGIPILTTNCCQWDDGTYWRILQNESWIPLATQSSEPPPTPYVADQLGFGFMQHEDATAWTEDFSRCFGWLVLDAEQMI
ncbi:hypothetical protein [Paenibacillus medicaginis]|uniref:Uncharacterized protein n=1 Tax=Paenibacillus medicaginis TaxID=1470560 RepID=A0ABV5C446_9BACL